MKIARQGSEMISGGTNSAPKKFQIEASGAAFAVLSSKLYNNKPLAIIRELSCNALDAHIAAGKQDVPFSLHLPTNFEPWFAIRDYGIGLAPEQIEELYCTYFATTKNESNAYVGAMGLGSKSPFCYTDNFTVTTFWNGKKHIYSAYIEKDGTPSVKKLSMHKTDEVNGLDVQFPVKPQDCWEFENMARIALEFFNPLPKLNVEDFDIPVQNYAVKTETWGMRSVARTHHTHGIRAIMGVVQYGVGNIDISRLTPDQRRLSEKPLDIFFPIGSLSVAASRETLSNDEMTIEAILTALSEIYTKMIEEIVAKIEACPNEWEARLLIFQLLASDSTQSMVQAAINEGRIYRKYTNFTLSKDKPFINELDFNKTFLSKFTRSGYGLWARKENLFTRRAPDVRLRLEADALKDPRKREEYDIEFLVEPGVLFVVNDIKFGGEKYLHHFIMQDHGQVENKQHRVAYLLSRYDKDTKQVDADVEFLQILSKVPGITVLKLSDLKARYPQLDVRMPGGPTGPRKDLMKLTGNGRAQYGPGWSKAWTKIFNTDIPQDSGKKYFVWIENFTTQKVVAPSKPYDYASGFVDYVRQVRTAKVLGLNASTPVYGVPVPSANRKTKLGSDWVELTAYVEKQIPKVMTVEKQKELSQLIYPFEANEYADFLKLVIKDKSFNLGADSPMGQFAALYVATAKKENEGQEALLELMNDLVEAKKFKITGAIKIQDTWVKMVEKTYPIFTLSISSSWGRNSRMNEKLLAYVKQSDELAKIQAAKVAAVVPTEQETVTV